MNSTKIKVFLDTSSLLAGLNSPYGASGIIISLGKLGKIYLLISLDVVAEAERAIKIKFPLLKIPFADFLFGDITISGEVTEAEVRRVRKIIDSEDAPIFVAALKAKANYLVTLDKKF